MPNFNCSLNHINNYFQQQGIVASKVPYNFGQLRYFNLTSHGHVLGIIEYGSHADFVDLPSNSNIGPIFHAEDIILDRGTLQTLLFDDVSTGIVAFPSSEAFHCHLLMHDNPRSHAIVVEEVIRQQ